MLLVWKLIVSMLSIHLLKHLTLLFPECYWLPVFPLNNSSFCLKTQNNSYFPSFSIWSVVSLSLFHSTPLFTTAVWVLAYCSIPTTPPGYKDFYALLPLVAFFFTAAYFFQLLPMLYSFRTHKTNSGTLLRCWVPPPPSYRGTPIRIVPTFSLAFWLHFLLR